jgi:formamidopyrimidine-DNA glycosylase
MTETTHYHVVSVPGAVSIEEEHAAWASYGAPCVLCGAVVTELHDGHSVHESYCYTCQRWLR